MQKEWNHQRIVSPVSSEVFSLPRPTQVTQGNREVGAPKHLLPTSQQLVSLSHRPLSRPFSSKRSGMVEFQCLLVKWRWKQQSENPLECENADVLTDWKPGLPESKVDYDFFGLGYDKTHTKVRRGMLKIPIIFWQKALCVITLRFSHGACPHLKF